MHDQVVMKKKKADSHKEVRCLRFHVVLFQVLALLESAGDRA